MKQKAFTLIEFLVIVAIVGILSVIVVANVSGARSRARDTQRKADLEAIAIALQNYYSTNKNWMEAGSGCGYSGNGNEWFNMENGTNYPKSMAQCLIDAGAMSSIIIDPTGTEWYPAGTTGKYAYMKYTCTLSGKRITYIFAKLENSEYAENADGPTNGTCHTAADTQYGMNYYKIVK